MLCFKVLAIDIARLLYVRRTMRPHSGGAEAAVQLWLQQLCAFEKQQLFASGEQWAWPDEAGLQLHRRACFKREARSLVGSPASRGRVCCPSIEIAITRPIMLD